MKSVKQTDFFKNIRQVREFEFGTFYFFDGLVISEMKEGVIFRWKMADRAIKAAHEVLGQEKPIVYISNRINSYFFYSVVGSTRGSFASLILERLFFRSSIRKFSDLEEAINWSVEKIDADVKLV